MTYLQLPYVPASNCPNPFQCVLPYYVPLPLCSICHMHSGSTDMPQLPPLCPRPDLHIPAPICTPQAPSSPLASICTPWHSTESTMHSGTYQYALIHASLYIWTCAQCVDADACVVVMHARCWVLWRSLGGLSSNKYFWSHRCLVVYHLVSKPAGNLKTHGFGLSTPKNLRM